MGQKVQPVGFRTGIMVDWQSRWYAGKAEFAELLVEDQKSGSKTAASYHPSVACYMDEEMRLGVCLGSDWTARSIPMAR